MTRSGREALALSLMAQVIQEGRLMVIEATQVNADERLRHARQMVAEAQAMMERKQK